MPSDEFFTEGNVLPEVRQAFASPERKEIGVIIRPAEDVSVEELVSFLRKKRIAGVEWTDYFARAIVRQRQVEILDKAKEIDKVWLDKPVEPKWEETTKTVKAEAAQKVFGAEGDGIGWAVLDSGIRHTHNFFKPLPGGPARVKRKADWNFASGAYKDGKGHGTHVAGIIAKLAPRCTIYDFRVLDNAGSGSSWGIIQAMTKIREVNRQAAEPKIHGANLSLGGAAKVGSYGIGHSPECQEATRLVNSGVFVCVAAGNDGYKELATIEQGKLVYFKSFMDIGITDPGNAEEVVTVGSVHKSNPLTYGPSYFSSRGPTGDGRCKPDLLAPGEKINSASHTSNTAQAQMSGTSMATPVVSAVVAMLLSTRKELIGRPRDVKRYLLETCTDLGRDRYFQGAGLVDALRLLQAV